MKLTEKRIDHGTWVLLDELGIVRGTVVRFGPVGRKWTAVCEGIVTGRYAYRMDAIDALRHHIQETPP